MQQGRISRNTGFTTGQRRGGHAPAIALTAALFLLTSAVALPAAAQCPAIEKVSRNWTGGLGANSGSLTPGISADGNVVVFASFASDLISGDTADSVIDVFAWDRSGTTMTKVTQATGGGAADGHSYLPATSADGRYVVLSSDASNLVPGDTSDGYVDVYLFDQLLGQRWRVSTPTTGFVNGHSLTPDVSADGRFVVFVSWADNLVAGDTPDAILDIFLWDRDTTTITKITGASGGGAANDHSWEVAISPNGRYVAFSSDASNLVGGDSADGNRDIFEWDRVTGITSKLTTSALTGGATNGLSDDPDVSGDGRYVVFESTATDLVPGDTSNGVADIFEWDRTTGLMRKITRDVGGGLPNDFSRRPAISDDGRSIAFESLASDLLVLDSEDGIIDVYVWARATDSFDKITRDTTGAASNAHSLYPTLSGDGTLIAFETPATNLVVGDPVDGVTDIYTRANCQYNAPPTVTLAATPLTAPAGSFVHLTAFPSDADGALVSTLWTFGDGTSDASAGDIVDHLYVVPGHYTCTVTVTDNDGDSGSAQVLLDITDSFPGCKPIAKISWDINGGSAEDHSDAAAISADGRYVLFESRATDLVPGDNVDALPDLYLWDRHQGTTTKISLPIVGYGPGGGQQGAMSADGRYVAFASMSTAFIPGDGDTAQDIFIWDRLAATFEKVTRGVGGAIPNDHSYRPTISADGAYVAFESFATNLVAGDTVDTYSDLYLWERASGALRKITVPPGGGAATGHSLVPDISADGRFVAYQTAASNLTTGDPYGPTENVLLWDRVLEHTTLLTRGSNGTSPANQSSSGPRISADGAYVVFDSWASNLVAIDTDDGQMDLFLWQRAIGTMEKITQAAGGGPLDQTGQVWGKAISGDGRYVAFHADATNLIAGGTTLGRRHVYVWDRLTTATELVSVGAFGGDANDSSQLPEISADGQWIIFTSFATDLIPLDVVDSVWDLFIAENCYAPGAPTITWAMPPPEAASGGDLVPVMWTLSRFLGPITDNQAHFGITSVLGSSDFMEETNAVHAHAFFAPNIGTFDSPRLFAYIVRALDNGTQILSAPDTTTVTAGVNPPMVTWVTPPPASIPSGSQFTVQWQLTDYFEPVTTNALGWGITTLLGQTTDQPGGNGTYSTFYDVPVVSSGGTLYFTAFAQNGIEFAFAPVVPVLITVP